METSNIILVTGGARSGKSAFAERYAAALPGRHAYVATARIFDEEMARRIAAHRRRRPSSWQTWEIPEDLPGTMERLCRSSDVVLVDCLTLYFSNYLFAHDGEADEVYLSVCGITTELKQRAVRLPEVKR